MIKHVTLINFNEGTSDEQKQAVLNVFESLPSHIPEVRAFTVGLDLGILEGNADLMVQASFDKREDFEIYSVHPAHMEIIFPVCGPVMASYNTAQIEA